jgi:hypothetical protein
MNSLENLKTNQDEIEIRKDLLNMHVLAKVYTI